MAPVVQPAKIRVVMLESGEEEREGVSVWPASAPPGWTLFSVGLLLPDACLFSQAQGPDRASVSW